MMLNKNKGKVFLLTGKIASGKSHYAKEYVKKNPAIILSCDELLLTLFDHCLGEDHPKMEQRGAEFFYGQAVQLTALGIDVLLDFGFWSKKSREEARSYFNQRNILTETWYFEVEDALRIKRLVQRNEKRQARGNRREYIIGQEMLERFDAQFQPPDNAETFISIQESSVTE